MTRHILLTFLSDVKKKGPKNGPWAVCKSKYDEIGDTYTTNESAVRYLLKKGWNEKPIQLERIFAFASNTVLENKVGANREDLIFPDNSIDENGISLTHLEYFKKRIADIVDIDLCMPEVEGLNHEDSKDPVCLYNDESEDIKLTMTSVIGMSGKIQKYFQEVKNENQGDQEVILHADMSGGFRHAAMMMMAVMRLIQFAGIKIGHVMYSNWSRLDNDPEYSGEGVVQEVGEIYGTYDLVSGAAEFTNFGSMISFREYFNARQQSEELKKLIASMGKFDEAIKISRRREFNEAVHYLKQNLNGFENYVKNWTSETDEVNTSAGVSDLLMKSLLGRIRLDYKELLGENVDELVYIEWCLKHGYLQQALTLYTESFPDFITENKLVFITDKGWEGIKNAQEDDDPRDPVFYMLSDYNPAETPILWLPGNYIKIINDEIKEFFRIQVEVSKLNYKHQQGNIDEGKLKNKQRELKECKENIDRLLNLPENQMNMFNEEIKNSFNIMEDILKLYYQKNEITDNRKNIIIKQTELRKSKDKVNKLLGIKEDNGVIYEKDKNKILNCLNVIERLTVDGFNVTLPDLGSAEVESIQGFAKFSKNDLGNEEKFKRIRIDLNNSFKGIVNFANPITKLLNFDKIKWDRKYKRCSKVEMLLYCGEIEFKYLKPEEILPVLDSYFEIKAIRNDTAHAKQDKTGRGKNSDVKNYSITEIKRIIESAINDVRVIRQKVNQHSCECND